MKRSLVAVALFLACVLPNLASGQKLIALTFDDGPRPYVLYGVRNPGEPVKAGLIDTLEKNGVKATFFLMGWRLTPKTWGERRETNIGITCIDAARDLVKRGHELENHTYGHERLNLVQKKRGSEGALADIEKGSSAIEAITGRKAIYIRPPQWVLPGDLRAQIEKRGYRVMTIATENPLAVRDVNSLDYLCAGSQPKQCPKPSLAQNVLRQIEAREKQGVTTHILTFHELSSTVPAIQMLIPELKARGYRFVRLDEYMNQVQSIPDWASGRDSYRLRAAGERFARCLFVLSLRFGKNEKW